MGRKSGSFGLWDFPAPTEKALHSKTWLEHCILRRSRVHYRSAGKSGNSGIKVRKERLEEIFDKDPARGYILFKRLAKIISQRLVESGNSIAPYVPLANYKAMLATVRECGDID